MSGLAFGNFLIYPFWLDMLNLLFLRFMLGFAGFKIMLNCWHVSTPWNPGCDAS